MKRTILLIVATLALCSSLSAIADDDLEHKLEARNSAIARKFNSQAHEYALQLAEANKQAQLEAAHNASQDTRDASAYEDDVTAARKGARRKTALVLTTVAAALAGGGALTYSWASNDEASIRAGGFATEGDISSAADGINVKQGIAFGAWGVAGILTTIALGLAL